MGVGNFIVCGWNWGVVRGVEVGRPRAVASASGVVGDVLAGAAAIQARSGVVVVVIVVVVVALSLLKSRKSRKSRG
jgi:hypothetical protein